MKRLSHEFGWKSKEVVETLEAKRKVKSQEYYEAKKKAIVRFSAACLFFEKGDGRRSPLQTDGPRFLISSLPFFSSPLTSPQVLRKKAAESIAKDTAPLNQTLAKLGY